MSEKNYSRPKNHSFAYNKLIRSNRLNAFSYLVINFCLLVDRQRSMVLYGSSQNIEKCSVSNASTN